jgi:hypothetical protein
MMKSSMAKPKQFVDSFDQIHINMISRAIDRAWEVLRHIDDPGPREEARTLLARCVVAEARAGAENQVWLVNKAIVRFRAERAQDAILFRGERPRA